MKSKEEKKNKRRCKIVGVIDYFANEENDCVDYFITNDVFDLTTYEKPCPNLFDDLSIFFDWLINHIIADGLKSEDRYIPVIAGYNLYSFMRTILKELLVVFDLKVVAQNETNFYSVEVIQKSSDGKKSEFDGTVLRFWDVQHLADKDIILSETDNEYLAFGIADYLQLLLKQNDYIKEDFLGTMVLTKSSLTRQYARNRIGTLKYVSGKGRKIGLNYANRKMCIQNEPYSYKNYCLRKACFNGGFTFISNLYACKIFEDVIEIDVNSMHHACLCGHFVPVNFHETSAENLYEAMCYLREKKIDYVLDTYHRPFNFAFNACVEFFNLRLKENSVFKKDKIGLIQREKFVRKYESDCLNTSKLENDAFIKSKGFLSSCVKGNFSFNKLNFAESAKLFVNEIEFFNICQVYDFDDIRVYYGEISSNFVRPSDFVSLQTNIFYKQKEDMKRLLGSYKEGKSYSGRVPKDLPSYMKKKVKDGTMSKEDLESYYTIYVKAKFNTVYGNQAQDVYNPKYYFNEDADILLDVKTVMNDSNFDEIVKAKERSLASNFLYGSRISEYSRMHLILAMSLLYDRDNNIKMISGDTDSIRFCSEDKNILNALRPLHKAIDNSLDFSLQRVRTNFSNKCSKMKKLGHFEFVGKSVKRIDYANKMYVCQNEEGRIEMTVAGFNPSLVIDLYQSLVDKYGFDKVFNEMFGYNTFIGEEISNAFEYILPMEFYIDGKPTIRYVNPTSLKLLDIDKQENLENVSVMRYFNDNNVSSPKKVYNDRVEVIDKNGKFLSYGI